MEFEGRTEREAVAKAAVELGSESFDVEVLEKSGGLFSRSKVKIRVKPLGSIPNPMGDDAIVSKRSRRPAKQTIPKSQNEESKQVDPLPKKIQNSMAVFVKGTIEHMGFPGSVEFEKMTGGKAIFQISSEHSNILIGRKGKNLDALQLLANVYLTHTEGDTPWRIVLDIEGYRERREKALIHMARKMADEAVRSRSSRLMDPMNPFERRLIHTAVSDRGDVVTQSEGEGLYKRVRIASKGSQRNRPSRTRR